MASVENGRPSQPTNDIEDNQMPRRSTSKAVVKWDEQLAQYAEEAYAAEQRTATGNYISTRGGVFTYAEAELPIPMPAIVPNFAFVNLYFDTPYDEDNPSSPVCFAVEAAGPNGDKNMVPHEDAPQPQADTCAECEWNKFGTDHRGKGKACRNTRRLALISPEDLATNGEQAEVVFLSLPPTSLKKWAGYVRHLAANKTPPFAVITDFDIERLQGGHAVTMTLQDRVDEALLPAILQLRTSIETDLLAPPQMRDEPEEKPKRRAPARGGRTAAPKGRGRTATPKATRTRSKKY